MLCPWVRESTSQDQLEAGLEQELVLGDVAEACLTWLKSPWALWGSERERGCGEHRTFTSTLIYSSRVYEVSLSFDAWLGVHHCILSHDRTMTLPRDGLQYLDHNNTVCCRKDPILKVVKS